jgi:hypothetical protein
VRATFFLLGASGEAEVAQREITGLIDAELRSRSLELSPSMRIERSIRAQDLAAEGHVVRMAQPSNELGTLLLHRDHAINREWLGTGAFAWSHARSLLDVAGMVAVRDQTVSHFGFSDDELRAFLSTCNHPVARIVPVGAAHDFGPVWDGYDLLREFSSITTVVA